MIKALAQALGLARIPYVIIGGIPASIWGRPRTTLDADIVLVSDQEEVEQLLVQLQECGFRVPAIVARKLQRKLAAKVTFGRRFSVDLRVATYSLDREAIERANTVAIFGERFAIASKEDIIVYKLARFDDLDKADIRAIVSRWGKKLDVGYVRGACRRLAEETGDGRIPANLEVALTWLS